jgi:hypothetical protein
MPGRSWARLTVYFLTADERTLLSVSADLEVAAHAAGADYTMALLETAAAAADPASLKRFRQNAANFPLAKRFLPSTGLLLKRRPKRLVKNQRIFRPLKKSANSDQSPSNTKSNRGKKSSSIHPSSSSTVTKNSGDPDSTDALPKANGALDKAQCDKWEDGSLRER